MMGMDYLWVGMEIPQDGITSEYIGELETFLETLTIEEAGEIIERSTGWWDLDGSEKRRIENAIDWLSSLSEESRETAISDVGGVKFLHTGGMSWGDYPTDCFEEILILDALQHHKNHKEDLSS